MRVGLERREFEEKEGFDSQIRRFHWRRSSSGGEVSGRLFHFFSLAGVVQRRTRASLPSNQVPPGDGKYSTRAVASDRGHEGLADSASPAGGRRGGVGRVPLLVVGLLAGARRGGRVESWLGFTRGRGETARWRRWSE
jgi:hypothetical protein